MQRYAFLLCLILAFSPARANNAPANAIASADPLATAAGLDILAAGGNAFDAAIAVSAVLAVVEPYSSGLGGGGFWLLHRAMDGKQVMIDGRERAPFASTRDMYLDATGQLTRRSIDGPLAAGIPGEPAALAYLAKHYGKIPLAQSLAPAIHHATQGFKVNSHYQRLAKFRLSVLRASTSSRKVFLHNDEVPALGTMIRQPDLANTLKALAKHGHQGFYQGTVAKQLVTGVKAAGGIWSQQDLASYQVVVRKPIIGQYRDIKITSASPPSSGGIVLLSALKILQGYPAAEITPHLVVEAMRRAYRDRAEYLGDPDFTKIPNYLTSAAYAKQLRTSITRNKATPSSALRQVPVPKEGFHTTHFSILDNKGNRVAATLSINYPFGSGFTPAGTGVLLNDEMDDFSAKPGVPNVYGLVGGRANAIEPGKRPLSSMSPTFLEDKQRIAIVGTPGGSRIISMVLLATLAFEKQASSQQIVDQPRFHHQYLPDVIQHEQNTFSNTQLSQLSQFGHHLQALSQSYGNMQIVIWDKSKQQVTAASDQRGVGQALVK